MKEPHWPSAKRPGAMSRCPQSSTRSPAETVQFFMRLGDCGKGWFMVDLMLGWQVVAVHRVTRGDDGSVDLATLSAMNYPLSANANTRLTSRRSGSPSPPTSTARLSTRSRATHTLMDASRSTSGTRSRSTETCATACWTTHDDASASPVVGNCQHRRPYGMQGVARPSRWDGRAASVAELRPDGGGQLCSGCELCH